MDIYQQLASIVAKEDKAKSELRSAQDEMKSAVRDNLHKLVDSGIVKVEVNRTALRMAYRDQASLSTFR